MGRSAYFVAKGSAGASGSGARKVKLTTAGDLIVGSTARTGVGFLLMPFTLLKTLSEVSTNPLSAVPQEPSLTLSNRTVEPGDYKAHILVRRASNTVQIGRAHV